MEISRLLESFGMDLGFLNGFWGWMAFFVFFWEIIDFCVLLLINV